MRQRTPKGRPISGILLLDKPLGISSNAALQQVKRLFHAQKAGHTGSLDNLATGLLPICLGEATKISSYLLDADKHYRALCKLGETTTTADAEGEILQIRSVENVSLQQIQALVPQFSGEIQQIPPMYSALKRNGQPLYKLAREGKTVEREARTLTIYSLDILNFTAPWLEIEVRCSKGTYIRTLAEDIGEALGCGAHIQQLRRLGVGSFADMMDLPSLQALAETGLEALDALLLPLEAGLPIHWTDLYLHAAVVEWILQGQAVQIPHAPPEGMVKLFDMQKHFIGIGTVQEDGRIAPKRLMPVNNHFC